MLTVPPCMSVPCAYLSTNYSRYHALFRERCLYIFSASYELWSISTAKTFQINYPAIKIRARALTIGLTKRQEMENKDIYRTSGSWSSRQVIHFFTIFLYEVVFVIVFSRHDSYFPTTRVRFRARVGMHYWHHPNRREWDFKSQSRRRMADVII